MANKRSESQCFYYTHAKAYIYFINVKRKSCSSYDYVHFFHVDLKSSALSVYINMVLEITWQ